MRPIDLVIFDCDGVLADSELISYEVMRDALAAFGVDVSRAHFSRHFLGRSFPTVAASIRESFRIPLPEDFEARYRAALLARFKDELRPTPGVTEVLDRLACRACVATSSSPERVQRTLQLLGFAARFGGDVFTASEVPRGKPAPDLFLHAAARMGAAPARTLVVEDSLPGIEAALAAGMHVMMYSGGGHLAGAEPPLPEGVAALPSWAAFPRELLKAPTREEGV